MYDVSIVVPVYNCDKYLNECIESLITQSYSNYEIVLVDDGSVDDSLAICNRYSSENSKIKVIHQVNSGANIARYNGVKAADSEFICFADADDMVGKNYISDLMKFSEGVDLVTSDCLCEDSNGNYNIRKEGLVEGLYDNNDVGYIINNMMYIENSNQEGVLPFMCTKLFKREKALEIFHNTQNTLKIYEDRVFVHSYILSCSSIYVTHQANYRYRLNTQSVMCTKHDDYLMTLGEYYVFMKTIIEKNSNNKKLLLDLERFIFIRIKMAPYYMRFSEKFRFQRYYFGKVEDVVKGKIVLYGAGAVGRAYFYQLSSQMPIENIYWTDKNWQSISQTNPEIRSLERMLDFPYNYVVLAVKKESIANEMREYLISLGVKLERILWSEPISID